jgi:ribosomal subunit interface protein
MELKITARNLDVSERFKQYVSEKSAKVEQFAHRPDELFIRVTRHDHNRNSGQEDQVELTVYEPGHVVRAEARAEDKFAAFDIAFGKLLERLRRYSDKKKVHRGGGHKHIGTSELAATDFAGLDVKPAEFGAKTDTMVVAEELPNLPDFGKSPVEIRRKVFESQPMSVEDAIDQMELVGHDFYLFMDAKTSQPSVVYRRKGWNYGVITLNA